jgi:two-component system nitrogen regulation sensor histidine kinase GlnL
MAFSHLPVCCILLDKQGHIMAANVLAQEHLNTSEKRLKGKHIAEFIAPADEINHLLNQVSQAQTISSDEFHTLAGHRPYSLYVSQQSDGAISLVMIAEGNRLEAEMQSRRYEMAEAVSRIALERAHEIKNPLAALRGATQLLGEQVSGDQLEIVEHMLGDIDRIKERVDGFLQIGPRANVQMQQVNIHALIDSVIRGADDAVKVQRSFDPSIPETLFHERRLRQAIENLWSNAIEAGSDLIVWETRVEHGITLAEHKGAVLSVKIISNGAEIPEHIKQKMFEPYVTGKARGNGLGLSIVQQVVQEHGGKVVVQSELMRTSFTMYLPLRTGA